MPEASEIVVGVWQNRAHSDARYSDRYADDANSAHHGKTDGRGRIKYISGLVAAVVGGGVIDAVNQRHGDSGRQNGVP